MDDIDKLTMNLDLELKQCYSCKGWFNIDDVKLSNFYIVNFIPYLCKKCKPKWEKKFLKKSSLKEKIL